MTCFVSEFAEMCGTTAAIGISNGTLAPNLGRVPILHWLLVRARRRLTGVHPQQLVIGRGPEQ
jgi:hypothetical protein